MKFRIVCLILTLTGSSAAALAAGGLAVPAVEQVWPQWQARIAVQSAGLTPLSISRLLEGSAAQRSVQGGAVFGDYYFARPSFGGFRASGGLMMGPQSGAPMSGAAAGGWLGLAVNGSGGLAAVPGADSATANAGSLPYLGLGFTGASWHNGLAITADLGLVSEHASAAGGVGRAIFGNQGMESALREMHLSPVFQLGVRYAF